MSKRTLTLLPLALLDIPILLNPGLASAQMDSQHSSAVMNYQRVNDRLLTGGHLLENGAAALRAEGVQVVINLRDDSPTDEMEQFVDQGIQWINIPVEWRDPQSADFARFSEVMSQYQDVHVLVQCSANYRASAMTYLYQVTIAEVDEEEARQNLLAIWDPASNATWSQFIEDTKRGSKALFCLLRLVFRQAEHCLRRGLLALSY